MAGGFYVNREPPTAARSYLRVQMSQFLREITFGMYVCMCVLFTQNNHGMIKIARDPRRVIIF